MLLEMNPLDAYRRIQKPSRILSTPRISACLICSLDVGKTPSYNGALIRPKKNADGRTRFC